MKAPNLRDYRKFRAELVSDGWRTPNTYCREFASPTNIPSIYLFLLVNDQYFDKAFVAYVGMSTKLLQRLTGHPVWAEMDQPGYWAMQWFKPTERADLRAVECGYIAKFDPPWNINGKPRGVILS